MQATCALPVLRVWLRVGPLEQHPDPQAVIQQAFADLAANVPADAILPKLRAVEADVEMQPRLKARLFRARAIATNRLGFGSEAIGDLHDARRLLEAVDDAGELAHVFLTLATVFTWRGDGREAALALLRAVAEASVSGDRNAITLAMIEAGRLQIENGRPGDAQALISRALQLGGDTLPKREHQRAWINLLQVSVAAGMIGPARELRAQAPGVLAGASPRLHMLERLECARIDRLAGDYPAARAALAKAIEIAPADPDSFERVEIAHVEAELALAEGNAEEAARLLHDVVIPRYASDDLTAREVQSRLLHAEALEYLQHWDECDRTLSAALRRALARGLNGYADRVRSRIAARGSDEAAGMSGDVPKAAVSDTAARFVRQRPLGAGGFAKVLRAYDLELGVEVAIKRSSLKDVYDPALRGRLLEAARTEVEAASRLNHPGIAHVYGLLADTNGDSLLVEEFVEGPTLRDAMKTRMDPARIYDLFARVAFSLAAVHATGVVHRDLKPDNIILRGGSAPVLVDFGIALLKRGDDSSAGGTPGYMPPEQARAARIDPRTDLYALGVTAYEVLTGEMPAASRSFMPAIASSYFCTRGITAHLVQAGVDAGAAHLIAQMMAPHPRWRPASAAIVGASFAEAAGRAGGRAH
jgi:tRNA A-37 threonylcarbamoyl transferase component Bud32